MELNNDVNAIINGSNNQQQSTSAIKTEFKSDIDKEISENTTENVINIKVESEIQIKAEGYIQTQIEKGVVSSNVELNACSNFITPENLYIKQEKCDEKELTLESQQSEAMEVSCDIKNNTSCSHMVNDTPNPESVETDCKDVSAGCLTMKSKKKTESLKESAKKCKKEKTPVIGGALSQLLDYGMSDSDDSEAESVNLSESSDTNSELSDELAEKIEVDKERLRGERRGDVFSTDDSSTYYDSDTSSDGVANGACAIAPTKTLAPTQPKIDKKMNTTLTKGELTLDDLPPIEQLQISVPETECVQIGTISSIVEQLVIVQSMPGMPAYDIDTLLFLDRGNKPLGRIFDVLGPVTEPFYAVRFNSYEQAMEAGVKPGTAVFCAPYNTQHTAYVFVSELLKMKGSDASWKHNNEPPEMFLDYSDDEQEAAARRLRSSKSKETTKSNSLERNKRFERQMNSKNILMNERFNPPSTSRRPEPERKTFQPVPNTPQNWSVPQAPRAMQRPEFCMPQNYGYFNQYNFGFPVMQQFRIPPMVAPNVFHLPQAFNPHVPPPIMRPQPVSYFPSPRHPRWVPPPNDIQAPRGSFGNGMNQ